MAESSTVETVQYRERVAYPEGTGITGLHNGGMRLAVPLGVGLAMGTLFGCTSAAPSQGSGANRFPFSIEVSHVKDPSPVNPVSGGPPAGGGYKWICFDLAITNTTKVEQPFEPLNLGFEDSNGNRMSWTVTPARWLRLKTWQPNESYRSIAYVHVQDGATTAATVYGPPVGTEPPLLRIPFPRIQS
jgi:hypothetical protein